MNEWSVTDWITAHIFLLVTAIGIWFWVKALVLTAGARRGAYLIDKSVVARWGLIDVLIVAFLWLASQGVTLSLMMMLGGVEAGQKLTADQAARFTLISGIVQLAVIGLSLARLARRYGHDEDEFGLARRQIAGGIRAGAIGFCMWVPLVWAIQSILVYYIEYTHPSFDRVNQSGNPRTLIDTWIAAVVIAPVVEELLFRGVVQSWLQRIRPETRSNPTALISGGPIAAIEKAGSGIDLPRKIHIPAILITSLLFGLAHFSQGPAPVSLFVLSLGLGYLYQRTGSLVACIVMHMVLNAVTMTLFTINLSTG